MVAGDLQAWRARRIAQRTITLSREAAAFVDAGTAPFAHKTRPAELERTITTAIARYMPEEAEARQQAAADGRRFEIDPRHHELNGLSGTADVYGTLDLADALDLEAAVAGTAATLKDLGSQDSLDVRRAAAVGEIARRQLALDLSGDRRRPRPAVGRRRTLRSPGRSVVLNLHLSHAAVTGTGGIGHLDNLNLDVLEQQIRSWCGPPRRST